MLMNLSTLVSAALLILPAVTATPTATIAEEHRLMRREVPSCLSCTGSAADFNTGFNDGYNEGYNNGASSVPSADSNDQYNECFVSGQQDRNAGRPNNANAAFTPSTMTATATCPYDNSQYCAAYTSQYPVGYTAGYNATLKKFCNNGYYAAFPQSQPSGLRMARSRRDAHEAAIMARHAEQW